MNQFSMPTMDFRYQAQNSSTSTKPTMGTEGIRGRQYQQQTVFGTSRMPSLNVNYSAPPSTAASHGNSNCSSAETAVSEALLTLSSAASNVGDKNGAQTFQSPPPASASTFTATPQSHPPMPPQQRRTPAPPLRRVSLCSPAASYPQQQPTHWPQQAFPPRHHHHQLVGTYETPKRAPSPALYHARPAPAEEAAPAAKKARTVSPPPALVSAPAAPNTNDEVATCVSCICPVCNVPIKGLGEHKVDWSQPVQGRQRAKTITSIKKHVKDFHEHEPIWNVIVNSLDVTPSRSSGDAQRVVTAQAFVTQALKKAALDQIPNSPQHLRSFRWTEKMMDQRVGIAKGFIQFGGQEYLRNKECHDEAGCKINPKSLRNLAYSLLQSMYNDLMAHLTQHHHGLQAAMAEAPLGLLRNRFQLLFAAPDKWNESWYMDPAKYSSRC